MDENTDIKLDGAMASTVSEEEVLGAEEATSGIYETGFQIIPSVSEQEAADIFSKIKSVIEANGTEIIAQGSPELISLAYEMRKKIGGKFQRFNKGYFGWLKFAAPRDSVSKIKSELEKIEEVLRFILVGTVRENTLISGKSAIIRKPESEREDFPKTEVTTEAMDEEINKTLEGLEIK